VDTAPYDFDRQDAEDTWKILEELVPDLEEAGPPQQINLLKPPIHEKLATYFLHVRRVHGPTEFLTNDLLFGIATRSEELESDIDEVPGIYILVSLVQQEVLKVGESRNLRKRITHGHLWYGNRNSESASGLFEFLKRRGYALPQYIRDQEITGLLFPMHLSDERDRRFIEHGLKKLLLPSMP
jgi:hypothetical protein